MYAKTRTWGTRPGSKAWWQAGKAEDGITPIGLKRHTLAWPERDGQNQHNEGSHTYTLVRNAGQDLDNGQNGRRRSEVARGYHQHADRAETKVRAQPVEGLSGWARI